MDFNDRQTKPAIHELNPDELRSSSPTGKNSRQLKDNRSSSAAQLRLVKAMEAGAAVHRKANHTDLPDQLKSGIENLSGHSMDDVKVHYNSDKPGQLNAHAYAQGSDIHVAPGQEKHLPHEAWHVVQQKQGRVQPTMQMKGKVNINDDKGLEREADRMGAKAMQAASSYDSRLGVQSRFHSIKTPGAGVLQPAWKETTAEPNATHVWDEPMDGVIWYANDSGLMWFRIANADEIREGKRDDYIQLEGEKNKKSWVAWNRQSIRPSPAFTADINGDYGAGFRDDNGDQDWNKWDQYMGFAIGSAVEADRQADVRKNPEFQIQSMLGEAQEYVANFRIITRQEYNIKLWEMAEVLAKMGPYTCIVSEAGKSNFWITARVLKKVQMLGGKAPKRIISVPTQEKGIMDAVRGPLNIDLKDAGTIIFLDDGSYSGSQLAKLINKVIAGAQNRVGIGLVAESQKAHEIIGTRGTNQGYLTTPYPIEEYREKTGLDEAQTRSGFPLAKKGGDSTHEDGSYMLGLYYKVPDFASVRFNMLTKDKGNGTPIAGYKPGRGVPVPGGIKIVDASEPYKTGMGTKASALGLEEATHQTGEMSRESKGPTSRLMMNSPSPATRSGLLRPGPSSRSKMSVSSSSPLGLQPTSGITRIPTMEIAATMKFKKGQKINIANIQGGLFELAEDYDPASADRPDLNSILIKNQ